MDQTNQPSIITDVDSWYQSTQGPQVSQTLSNMAGQLIPVVNLILASWHINILPQNVNIVISIAVFIYFGVRAVLGYVKAKKVFVAKLGQMQRDNVLLSQKLAGVSSAIVDKEMSR